MAKKLTTTEFISRAKSMHDGIYDYSKVEYINGHTKVIIGCKIHGEFLTIPHSHLSRGIGCPKCSGQSKLTTKEFIKKSKIIHGNLYNYNTVNYENQKTKVTINCNIHGDFEQNPDNHLTGSKCPRCVRVTCTEDFITLSKKLHGDLYDYSKTHYITANDYVTIICKKHGEFKQLAKYHTNKSAGCPKCSSSKGEQKITKLLEESNIIFETQKTFDNCKNIRKLPFDFYLTNLNICIEYDGIQHFKAVDYFGGDIAFEKTKQNDQIKTEFCNSNNIKLIRVAFNENIEEVLKLLKK